MKLLQGGKEKGAMRWFDEAAKVAAGLLCLRAKCGSVKDILTELENLYKVQSTEDILFKLDLTAFLYQKEL